MALAEISAFFDILTKVGEIVVKTGDAYYRASSEMEAFPQKVDDLKLRQKDWESLLKTYTLPPDDSSRDRLKAATTMLLDEQKRFDKNQKINCCTMFCKKVTFPSGMLANLDDVSAAFDGILKGMKDKKEATDMIRHAANNRLASFSFPMDEKYVPIMETLSEIQAALGEETPSGALVLLHGESGQGKSTLVKYLALTCQGFPGGVFFFTCGKTANAYLLMKKLWEDLGFGSEEDYWKASDVSPDPEKQASDFEQQQTQKLDTLRRKVMAELGRRESQSMLMIFDDVWNQDIINAVRIPLKHVKYVFTSQKSYLCRDVTGSVRIRMAKPSMEEAHQILRKYSGSSTEAMSFDSDVQKEVDQLVKQVDSNPFVLANLGAAIIKGKPLDSFSDSDAKKLRKLREDLYDLLIVMDERTLERTSFGESYKHTIRASITMVFDVLPKDAMALLDLMVLCKDLTVHEVILKVWFHQIYGSSTKSTAVKLQYSYASEELKAQAIVIAETESVQWRAEPWTRWSIHELRRRVICEARRIEVDKLLQSLINSQSQEEDQGLVAALCFLYGDETCRKRVQLESRLEIWKPFRVASDSTGRALWRSEQVFGFIKPFVMLLHPRADEELHQTLHKSAKQIILYFLKRGTLHDEVISRLLRHAETALPTCSALRSILGYSLENFALPKTKQALAMAIGQYLDVEQNSTTCDELHMYLQALVQIESKFRTRPNILEIVPHLPTTLFTLLKRPQYANVSSELLRALGSLPTTRVDRITITSISDLLETLVIFLDKVTYPDLFEVSVETLLRLACRDEDIRFKFAAVPDALLKVTNLLPFTVTAQSVLESLATTPIIARQILSTPGVLTALVDSLGEGKNLERQSTAMYALKALSTTCVNRKLILAYSEVMERLLALAKEDTTRLTEPPSLLSSIVGVVVSITNGGMEMEHGQSKELLAAALEKCMALLQADVNPAIQWEAVQALRQLASNQTIRNSLIQSYPKVGNELLKLMNYHPNELFKSLTEAFYTVVVEDCHMEDGEAKALVALALEKYMALFTDNSRPVVQEQAVRSAVQALSKLASNDSHAIRNAFILFYPKVGRLLIESMNEDTRLTFWYTLTNAFNIIVVALSEIEGGDVQSLVVTAVQKYVSLLACESLPHVQEQAVRALSKLASKQTIHTIVTQSYPNIGGHLVGLINKDASSRLLRSLTEAFDTIVTEESNVEGENTHVVAVAALEKYIVLLADDVDVEVEWTAINAVLKLASKQSIRRTLIQSHQKVIYQVVGLMNDDSRFFLDRLSLAFYTIVVNNSDMGSENFQNLVGLAMQKFVALLADDTCEDVQEWALGAVSKLASVKAIRKIIILSYPEVVQQLLRLMSSGSITLLNRLSEAFYTVVVDNTEMEDGKYQPMVASAVRKYMELLADDTLPIAQEQAVRALSQLASKHAIRMIMIQSCPNFGDQLVRLINPCSSGPLLRILIDLFQAMVAQRTVLGNSKRLKFMSEAVGRCTVLLEEGVESKLREGAVQALRKLTSDPEACKLLESVTLEKLVDMVKEGAPPPIVECVTYIIQRVVANCSTHKDQCKLLSCALERYVALLDSGVEPSLKSEAARALGAFASLRANLDIIIANPSALQKLSEIITIDETPSVLRDVAFAVGSITLGGTNLKDPLGRFFSTALKGYISLLAAEVDVKLQEEAVRALRNLTSNEHARRLVCSIPDAIPGLVRRLNGEFDHAPESLRELAQSIYKLACVGQELGEVSRRTILSKLMERCIELLGDKSKPSVQAKAVKVLAELSYNPEARRALLTRPKALDRISELLNANTKADVFQSLRQIVYGLTISGTNLEVKTTVTFVLEVIGRLVKLLAHVKRGGATHGLRCLIGLAYCPSIRKLILSYPKAQEHLLQLQMGDSTPPKVVVEVAIALKIMSWKESDLDDRILTEYLSSSLKNYIALQADDPHLEQSHEQVAARILDVISSDQAVYKQVTISHSSVECRLVKLLETEYHNVDVRFVAMYLLLVDDVNVNVDCSKIDNQLNSSLVELKTKALNSFSQILVEENLSLVKRRNACFSVAMVLFFAADCRLLVSACPFIKENLVEISDFQDKISIQSDMGWGESWDRRPSFNWAREAMLALTLIDPSSADQMLLSSSGAYFGRGEAKVSMQMYDKALLDYDRAVDLNPSADSLLRKRAYIRARLADESGALYDLQQAIQIHPESAIDRAELGILKQLMGNSHDALVDLNMAQELIVADEDVHMYSILKHKGYVKFLLGDESGARSDAKKAILSRPFLYRGNTSQRTNTFGSLPIRYLEFVME